MLTKIKSWFAIQKLDFLIALYVFCTIVSELMGSKTFPIFSIGSFKLNASTAIFVLPIIYSINDVITEVFGPERTRSIIRSSIIMVFLLSLASLFFTSLPPSTRYLKSEPAYDLIFKQTARISIASLLAFALSDILDLAIFMKIRESLGKKALWFRNNASNIISLFFDTVIFMTLAFYAFDKPLSENYSFLVSIVLPYWFMKCFMSVIETPFVYLGVRWLKGKTKK
jgi:queuosine precursor transporter